MDAGQTFSRHSAVISSIHRMYVKTGKLSPDLGKDLDMLFALRAIGDYEVQDRLTQQQAGRAITAAEAFIRAARALLGG